MASAKKFVATAPLPDYPRALTAFALDAMPPTKAPPSDQPSGYIDSGSLVSFVADIPSQSQEDVLNSTLFGQAVASAQYDREQDTKDWYATYGDALRNLGWATQEFQFENISTGGTTITVDAVVLEILGSIATDNEVAVAEATINGMKSLDQGDGRLTLWESSSHTSTNGNFQVFPVDVSGGIVVMKLAAFYFSTTKTVDRILWFSASSSEVDMYKSSQIVNLDESIYSQVRQDVKDRLGDHAKTFVQNVPLKF